MTDYRSIKGQKVQNFTTDPENPVADQLWYNETLGDLKIRKTSLGSAWSSGGNMNTGRRNSGGAGTQTAALATGGGLNPPTLANTASYDGSSWTEVNDLNTARFV